MFKMEIVRERYSIQYATQSCGAAVAASSPRLQRLPLDVPDAGEACYGFITAPCSLSHVQHRPRL